MLSGLRIWHPPPIVKIDLTEDYSSEKYPKFDNCDAICVNRVADIPKDFEGLMGVPVSFLYLDNSSRFKIIATDSEIVEPVTLENGKSGTGRCYLNGHRLYARIIIKRNKNESI